MHLKEIWMRALLDLALIDGVSFKDNVYCCVFFFLIEKIIEKSYKNSSRNWHFNLKIKCEWKEEDFIFLFYLLLSEAAC